MLAVLQIAICFVGTHVCSVIVMVFRFGLHNAAKAEKLTDRGVDGCLFKHAHRRCSRGVGCVSFVR